MDQERARPDRNNDEQPAIDGLDRHASFDLLARIAYLYYLEDKTQNEIAQEFSLSRQKVQRLLKQAKDQRIVEIHVHAAPVLHIELENQLKVHFGLHNVIIAPSHPDEKYRRHSVARAAAAYLERHIKDDSLIAVGLGRNSGEVANFFQPTRQYKCTFVSAMGSSPYIGASINPNDICSKFAAHSGGKAQTLYAPVYLESRRVRDLLLEQDTIKLTVQLARKADIAIMGIGTPTDDSILVQAGCLSLSEARRLREIGAVGEILGNYFSEDGKSINSDLDGRLIALSLHDLRKIPLTIAVACEIEKSRAILGALRANVIQTLVVECELAIEILRLAGVTDLKQEETLLGL